MLFHFHSIYLIYLTVSGFGYGQMQLLLQKGEPFLIAPMKYFDKEALSSVFKVIDAKLEGNDTTAETHWQTFTNLLNFGFLLALRSSKVSLILLHFSQRFAEKVGAFQMLDLADSEGHEVCLQL